MELLGELTGVVIEWRGEVADEITAPGSLDAHPYRAQRPMPAPHIDDVLTQGAARGLLEHLLQAGGHISLAQQAEFAASPASRCTACWARTRRPGPRCGGCGTEPRSFRTPNEMGVGKR